MGKNIARLYSAELEGIDAKLIEVEADINVGLHAFNIVGLADRSLNEAKERVNSALKNSGVKPPNRENRKITINLAPADFKKAGSHYDLAIALGYLLASGQIKKFVSEDKIFLGELALDGRLRPIMGALNIAQRSAELGFKYLFLPQANAEEASAIEGIIVMPLNNLKEVIDFLNGQIVINAKVFTRGESDIFSDAPDFSEIKGQESAKRALTIAAAGHHNVLMIGPPGVGKSFLARALASIMPALTLAESIEVTKIWSAAGQSPGALISQRPFRAPHQTISTTALVGGGGEPRPGEISLAHRGILFLDELPEFQQGTLEALRQPLEAGAIHIARAKQSLIFPARFTLVAAMNPCPCGYYGASDQECVCTAYEVIRYQKRISGPLLDRIDLQVKVGKIKIEELRREKKDEAISPALKERITVAMKTQARRFAQRDTDRTKTNAEMSSREAQRMAMVDPKADIFLRTLDKSKLSPRGYYRLLKVARTIADLEDQESVSAEHLAEAFSYLLKEEF